MLNVGLTGNIAAGKSVVVGLFRRWGATIIDADELARAAQAPGSDALSAIVRRFGRDVLEKDGALDRAALRSKVMCDQDALTALNAIVHPVVQQRRAELQRDALRRGDVLVVNDIPLLFEATDPTQFDVIVLVDAPIPLRRTRLRAMRGLSNDDADRMIAAQMPAERKRPSSQFVIENAGSLKQLEAQTRTVFRELRRRAAGSALGPGGGPTALRSCSSPRTRRKTHRLSPPSRDATTTPERRWSGSSGSRTTGRRSSRSGSPTPSSPPHGPPRPHAARGRSPAVQESCSTSATIPIPSPSGSTSAPGGASRSRSPRREPPDWSHAPICSLEPSSSLDTSSRSR
jgi:dephospho-CoA kinase